MTKKNSSTALRVLHPGLLQYFFYCSLRKNFRPPLFRQNASNECIHRFPLGLDTRALPEMSLCLGTQSKMKWNRFLTDRLCKTYMILRRCFPRIGA